MIRKESSGAELVTMIKEGRKRYLEQLFSGRLRRRERKNREGGGARPGWQSRGPQEKRKNWWSRNNSVTWVR